jgi:hypothetical protein
METKSLPNNIENVVKEFDYIPIRQVKSTDNKNTKRIQNTTKTRTRKRFKTNRFKPNRFKPNRFKTNRQLSPKTTRSITLRPQPDNIDKGLTIETGDNFCNIIINQAEMDEARRKNPHAIIIPETLKQMYSKTANYIISHPLNNKKNNIIKEINNDNPLIIQYSDYQSRNNKSRDYQSRNNKSRNNPDKRIDVSLIISIHGSHSGGIFKLGDTNLNGFFLGMLGYGTYANENTRLKWYYRVKKGIKKYIINKKNRSFNEILNKCYELCFAVSANTWRYVKSKSAFKKFWTQPGVIEDIKEYNLIPPEPNDFYEQCRILSRHNGDYTRNKVFSQSLLNNDIDIIRHMTLILHEINEYIVPTEKVKQIMDRIDLNILFNNIKFFNSTPINNANFLPQDYIEYLKQIIDDILNVFNKGEDIKETNDYIEDDEGNIFYKYGDDDDDDGGNAFENADGILYKDLYEKELREYQEDATIDKRMDGEYSFYYELETNLLSCPLFLIFLLTHPNPAISGQERFIVKRINGVTQEWDYSLYSIELFEIYEFIRFIFNSKNISLFDISCQFETEDFVPTIGQETIIKTMTPRYNDSPTPIVINDIIDGSMQTEGINIDPEIAVNYKTSVFTWYKHLASGNDFVDFEKTFG